MKIDKIIDILSGYGSEKGFDFVISKVRELFKKKDIKRPHQGANKIRTICF